MITINFNTTISDIKRHLSIIGKRAYAKDGRNLFSDITTSTAEDPIFKQYITLGAKNVEAALMPLVENSQKGNDKVTITLRNGRGSTSFDSRCSDYVQSYVTLFSVGEYLAMMHPDMAGKYRDDAVGTMQSLVVYAYHKEAPAASTSSYADINGTSK